MKQQVTITLRPSGERLAAPAGQTLLEALRGRGFPLDAPCGGKGTCGKCRVLADGREVLACQYVLTADVTVELPEQARVQVLTGDGAAAADGQYEYVLSFDVGTTTVVAFLSDGRTGRQLSCASAINPQSAYGADVIARIQYELEHRDGRMGGEIRACLRRLTLEAAEAAGIPAGRIGLVTLVGNTAMHHLLLGLDVGPLVKPPYMPSERRAMELPGADWLPMAARVRVLPNIAGFVGADTVGCMVSAGFDRREELTLLIDIGTNGEMVLGDRRRRIACSTAAGPAFEGAKIRFGMRGAPGAIDHVSLTDGAIDCHVIGGGEARGICGSGVLDAVYTLLQGGFVDESGRMCPEDVPGPWMTVDNQPAFLLRDGVYLTQKDIREVQLAKAAIRAGIELLLDTMGREKKDVREVLLAGAFGSYLSPESACGIGMLPRSLLDRVRAIGNAAGEGAKQCALQASDYRRSIALAEETEFLELASLPAFQDCYVDCLSFDEEEEEL